MDVFDHVFYEQKAQTLRTKLVVLNVPRYIFGMVGWLVDKYFLGWVITTDQKATG